MWLFTPLPLVQIGAARPSSWPRVHVSHSPMRRLFSASSSSAVRSFSMLAVFVLSGLPTSPIGKPRATSAALASARTRSPAFRTPIKEIETMPNGKIWYLGSHSSIRSSPSDLFIFFSVGSSASKVTSGTTSARSTNNEAIPSPSTSAYLHIQSSATADVSNVANS